MTLRHKLEIAASVLALLVIIVVSRAWLAEHDARLKSDAEAAATKVAFDKLEAVRVAAVTAEAERDRARDATNAATIAEVAKLRTPAQVLGFVNREVPGANAVVSTPPPASGSKPDAPTPKAVVTLDALALDTRLGSCRVAETNLSTCQANLDGREKSAAAADDQIKLLKKANGDLQDELKGGTFFTRVKKAAKWIAFGAIAGAAALCGTGHCK